MSILLSSLNLGDIHFFIQPDLSSPKHCAGSGGYSAGPAGSGFRSLLLDQPWSAGCHRSPACAPPTDCCGPCVPLPATQTERYRLEGGQLRIHP